MSELVAAMCCSHSPTLRRMRATSDQGWLPLASAYERLARELAAARPDVVVTISNDHFDNFFLDAFPTFAVGVADQFDVADEGIGGYWDGKFRGHPRAGMRLANVVIEAGFDLTVCYGDVVLDHAIALPVKLVGGHEFPPIIPVFVNCTWPPMPSMRRCWALGSAIRDALDTWDEPLRYAVLATGGLSHQLTGPDFGAIYPEFDREALSILVGTRRSQITTWTVEDLARGGDSASELGNWVVAAGIVGEEPIGEVVEYSPLPDALTGMGVIRFELADAQHGDPKER